MAKNEQGLVNLAKAAVDPALANVRNDPRWLPFLRKIGKAPEQLAAIKFDVKLRQEWGVWSSSQMQVRPPHSPPMKIGT